MLGNKKIFWDDYRICLLGDHIQSSTHKHGMIQIFFSEHVIPLKVGGAECDGKFVIVGSNVEHEVMDPGYCGGFLLIESASDFGKFLSKNLLREKHYVDLGDELSTEIGCLNKNGDDEHYLRFVAGLYDILKYKDKISGDPRVADTVKFMNEAPLQNLNVADASKNVYLSESRLSHLFRESVGVSLKSALLQSRLKRSYLRILAGDDITDVAMEAGFSSPSHMADVNRKLMGMSITDAFKGSILFEKNSGNIEA